MSFLPGMTPSFSRGGAALNTLSIINASNGSFANGSSPRTVTGLSIGTAFSTRRVVALISIFEPDGSPTLSSVTIGGVAATIHVEDSTTNDSMCAIASAVVPSGTTADVVLTFSSAAYCFSASACGVALLTFDDSLPSSSTPVTATASSNTNLVVTANLSVSAGAIFMAIGLNSNPYQGTMAADQTLTTAVNGTRSRYGYLIIGAADASFDTTYTTTVNTDGNVLACATWR